MKTETLTLGGQPFFLRHWGDPTLPKLLLLHGFPEYGGAWAGLAPLLSDRFHVLAPDQRGYGQSWAPPEIDHYRLHHLVGDMVALIGDTGPVHVMGHDWGASVAYGIAMARPDLVRSLIVANGVHPIPFQRALAAGGAQTEASQYIPRLRKPTSHDVLAQDDFALMWKMFSAGMNHDWMTDDMLAAYKVEWSRPGRLNGMINWYRASPLIVPPTGETVDMPDWPVDQLQVRCPHLLIWGEDDTALLPEATEGLEEFAPHLTRVTLTGADHWLIHQKTDDIARIMRDWLGKQD
jgi:pimeloyl-ACP methyl ester carboxylesterase